MSQNLSSAAVVLDTLRVNSSTGNKSEAIKIRLNQHFEADFPKKVSLKILNSGIIQKTFTHLQIDTTSMEMSFLYF